MVEIRPVPPQQREGVVKILPDRIWRAQFLVAFKSDPFFAPILEQYPAFGVALAQRFVDAKLRGDDEPTQFEIARTMAAYNIPRNLIPGIFSSGGGGRSQKDIENAIRAYQTTILNRSRTLGLVLSPQEVDYIARVAENGSFSMEQVDEALRGLIKWDALQPGALTGFRDDLKTTAKNYFVSLGDDTINDWATRLATGQGTEEGFQSVLREQAKLANPWLSTYIDQGLSPSELLAPARRTIAQSLGINEAQVDFSDPKYMRLVTVTDDKGNTRLANTVELRSNIRQDERWASSDEASQMTSSMARLIAQVFGKSVF